MTEVTAQASFNDIKIRSQGVQNKQWQYKFININSIKEKKPTKYVYEALKPFCENGLKMFKSVEEIDSRLSLSPSSVHGRAPLNSETRR